MLKQSKQITSTELIAVSTQILTRGDFKNVSNEYPKWNTSSARLFENEYCIVGVAVFERYSELIDKWPTLQDNLVSIIEQKVGHSERKAWDGYLVLLTSDNIPLDDTEIENIRNNTLRLRKLVATGDDLSTAGDVERLLLPLLPFSIVQKDIAHQSVLDLLPDILVQQGVEHEVVDALIQAFKNRKPLMESLYNCMEQS